MLAKFGPLLNYHAGNTVVLHPSPGLVSTRLTGRCDLWNAVQEPGKSGAARVKAAAVRPQIFGASEWYCEPSGQLEANLDLFSIARTDVFNPHRDQPSF
jgi:hypothetical protein